MKKKPNDAPHVITIGDGWTVPNENGVGRRTLVQATAWTIPVVATAVGAPLAAASTTELTLTFVDGPYQGVACGPLDDITVHAANGATPAAGVPITVTLPAGLTWSDGTTTPRTLPADANGNVVLSGVQAPNRNGTFNLGATSGTATAASSVEVQGANSGVVGTHGGDLLPPLPNGVLIEDVQTNSTSNGVYTLVLGSDGNVYSSGKSTSAGSKWSAWGKSSSPLAGSIEHISVDANGLTNVVASDTQVGMLGGGPASAPLPNGATIVEVESYGVPNNVVVVARGSDGRAYRNSLGDNGWVGWAPIPVAGVTNVAVSETGGAAVVANSTQVTPVGGGAASPALPNGATIEDIQMYVAPNGSSSVLALGSDGRAYSNAYDPRTGTWTAAWSNAQSSLNGSVEHISVSKTGGSTAIASSNRISHFGGAVSPSPVLPNGATIVDFETTVSGGTTFASALGSDGRSYVTRNDNGRWAPWGVSRVGQGNLEFLSVSEAQGWTLVASNPRC